MNRLTGIRSTESTSRRVDIGAIRARVRVSRRMGHGMRESSVGTRAVLGVPFDRPWATGGFVAHGWDDELKARKARERSKQAGPGKVK
jgi:hypothetical protein